ncbi:MULTISPECIES: PTS sugar transporter subunit IIB [unclassified Lactobacillus]|uniref:PTS sugar transporter subunit IIB n=1 Tax=unclassified Lactobacillus TaxID=2620435 RepID=UPI000EFCC775|nr:MULTISPECIES: PTS sugar transporter subunit IIB [unclassified Lactobacillus]RMC25050.1 PTS sugar transporter subunit IIB [Lactobacillus sp. ESL0247]RMC29205.1 PTS sugar transporter subunit IIB [Lactobacillus sp. ESL0246]RMC32808.1 PTS sugar transporter subunit IIB [Lactobacillus sp. ESL0245]
MLCCSAGMSTSLLVTKMKKTAEEQGKDVEIFAVPAAEADDKLTQDNINCILLGPQVRYMENEFKQKVEGKNIGLAVIDMQAYGLMDGSKVLAQAYQIMGE